MSDFLKNSESIISNVFKDLSTNQKMSLANLLLTIAGCDVGQGNREKELLFLNYYRKILGVSSNLCMAYLERGGRQGLIDDLKKLSQNQKEFLVIASFELITCDGNANETELTVTIDFFKEFGLDEDKFMQVMDKTEALMKRFLE